jgi:hypothetical protein
VKIVSDLGMRCYREIEVQRVSESEEEESEMEVE